LSFFFLLASNIHIFGLASFIFLSFDHFVSKLTIVMGLFVQPHMRVAWSLSTCPLIFPPLGFCCLPNDIRVLGAPFGSMSFSSSFLQEAIDEDVHHADMHSKVGEHSCCFRDLILVLYVNVFLFASCILAPPKFSMSACIF
jgi:hypothetical protein